MRRNANKFLFAKLGIADILAKNAALLKRLADEPERNDVQMELDRISVECVETVLNAYGKEN